MGQAEPRVLPTQQHDKKAYATGTAVCVNGNGLLIIGRSGTGKSGLALTLMSYGATLIGDDRVGLQKNQDAITLNPPPTITGQIEARGIGVLSVKSRSATLRTVLDLDHAEGARFPEPKWIDVEGTPIPLLHKFESPYFSGSLWQYLLSLETL